MTTISDIHAGLPDAKEDIQLQEYDFLDVFCIPPRLNLSTLIQGNKYFLIGNKGLGKTAVLRYLNHYVSTLNPTTKTSFILFEQDYLEHQKRLRDVSSITMLEVGNPEGMDDFTYLWRWHFFMTMVRDNDVPRNERIFVHDDAWKKFTRFVEGVMKESYKVKIHAGIDLAFSLFDVIRPNASIELPEFSIGRKDYTFEQAVEEATRYFRDLDRRNVPYYIFVDELDVYRREEERYTRDLRLVHDLILQVKWLNLEIQKLHWANTKVIGTIRPEILNAMEDRFGTRIRREVSGLEFTLCWDFNTSETYTVPIMELFLKRIERAQNRHGEGGGTQEQRYKQWFPEKIHGMEPSQYIRSITWSRPRDIVGLLSCCINARGGDVCFSEAVFDCAMHDISELSYREIKAELEATYPSRDVEELFDCFWELPPVFTKEQFLKNAGGCRVLREKGIEEVLEDLYRTGVIGQLAGDTYRWFHYGDAFNHRGKNVVHPALRRRLGVLEPSGSKEIANPIDRDVEEWCLLGKACFKNREYAKAVEWFTKAAVEGDARAQGILGYCYGEGLGVTRDDVKAVEWLTKAAEQGDASSQTNLGRMYESGRGVSQSYEKALQWYTMAAEQGDAAAQYSLGLLFLDGLGTERDISKARFWLEKAAKKHYKKATSELEKLK